MNYSLEIIQGTEHFVIAELSAKYPDIDAVYSKPNQVSFESDLAIDMFRNLYSPLRIHTGKIVRNLYRREWQVDFVPAGVNPALAYILCMAADLHEGDQMLDPFCGGATIPVTASLYFEADKVFASDISGKAINAAQKNFAEAKIAKNRHLLLRSNVSMLKFPKEYFDKIVTNLPFGIRVGNHENNEKIYEQFAKKCSSLLAYGGTVVVLTSDKQLLFNVMAGHGFELAKKYDIRQGGLSPSICIYKRKRR